MFTLNSVERHCVAYVIGAYDSNAWNSGNPESGVYEADTTRSLDARNCGNPACQQGGWQLSRYLNLQFNPTDSRIKLVNEDICQTLSGRMGTGGCNVPLVLEVKDDD